jgi:hypothetical protein
VEGSTHFYGRTTGMTILNMSKNQKYSGHTLEMGEQRRQLVAAHAQAHHASRLTSVRIRATMCEILQESSPSDSHTTTL